MYLNLFHGRKDKNQVMRELGLEGPSFKVSYVHGTYASNIKVFTGESSDAWYFWYFKNMLKYDGIYYRDWSVTDEPRNEVQNLTYSKMNSPIT